ncbi:hypothetical protein OUZ56_031176 [Daphnia magna]|uniref:Uncharacterized protein n=1 Tax=Daphnia magna TaxID=35525 RepID=A0ABQ9ZUB7_9CRUS|nr:hypothetical protein OUZ56_031176 [Daphnia magna]
MQRQHGLDNNDPSLPFHLPSDNIDRGMFFFLTRVMVRMAAIKKIIRRTHCPGTCGLVLVDTLKAELIPSGGVRSTRVGQNCTSKAGSDELEGKGGGAIWRTESI